MKNTILGILLMITAHGLMAQSTIEGKVMEVIEGDLIKVATGDEIVSVKLRNVECPEIAQEYGKEAKHFTEKSCLNRQVKVVFKSYDRDRNVLGTVTTEKGRDLGYALIKKGLAWHYTRGLQLGPNSMAYMALEKEVKEKEKGLWAQPDPMAPWIFRARQNRWEGKTSM